MLHLSTERLAELGDARATADEDAHFAACAQCAGERLAFRSLVALAHAERESFALPLTRWDAIVAQLSVDAVPSYIVPIEHAPSRRRMPGRGALKIAAALLFMTGGAVFGRITAGASPLPNPSAVASLQPTPDSDAALSTDSSTFASIDDARHAQQQSELTYQQAVAFLARYDTTGAGNGSPVAYRSRLAALDRVLSTTREAMREAPHDPVINGYYLTTLGQREATLQQLNTALPATLRVNSF